MRGGGRHPFRYFCLCVVEADSAVCWRKVGLVPDDMDDQVCAFLSTEFCRATLR